VDRVIAYRTVPAPGGAELAATLGDGAGWCILLSSPSTLQFLLAQLGPAGPTIARRALLACIGPTTAAACRELGLEPAVVAEQYTEEGLVNALVLHQMSMRPGRTTP
jgi:uroporphyrinogen-III synthase